MLFRKIKKEIENWIDNGKDALLITGARQVGKSFIIRETLKEKKVNYVEFNFIDNLNLIPIFNSALKKGSNTFLLELRVAINKSLPNGTIIFLDEIQECKEIITSIKFLVEMGNFRYVLSGSLLGVELIILKSAPVGYLHTLDMFPLDFEEFLIANGLGNDVIRIIESNFKNITPVNDIIHNKLIEAFYRYLIVGGMPEAVNEYINSNDLVLVSNIHNKIIREYKRDFTKYEKNKKLDLINIYNLIPSELDSKNKRYTFTNLDSNSKFNKYENSFNWLINAGVCIPTFNVTEFEIPLEASKKSNLFKLFSSDAGLLTTQYGNSTILRLLDMGKDINCGAMFENAIAQELFAHNFKTFYFNNKKYGEVDFLIEYDNQLLPIEVKSGKDYTKHSALSYFMETKQFTKAFVLSNYNISTKDNIIYYPIYMIMFLNNKIDIENSKVTKLNLASLSKL